MGMFSSGIANSRYGGTAMIRFLSFLTAALVLIPASAMAAPAPDNAFETSEWRNPKNTVHIRAQNCGTNLCGTIIWASPKARADAAAEGRPELVGTEILRDFKPEGAKVWRGSVYVPDVRRTFAGTLTFIDADTMVGKGCLLFGLLCKTQTWKRLR